MQQQSQQLHHGRLLVIATVTWIRPGKAGLMFFFLFHYRQHNGMVGYMPNEFMSQSASRCLLCLARDRVIIHTNGRPHKTELGGSNPLSCVRRVALFAKPCWQPRQLHIQQKKNGNKRERNIKCVLDTWGGGAPSE